MTNEEFDRTGMSGNMFAMHDGKLKAIASCDFQDRTYCLFDGKFSEFNDESWKDTKWVHCNDVSWVQFGLPIDVKDLVEGERYNLHLKNGHTHIGWFCYSKSCGYFTKQNGTQTAGMVYIESVHSISKHR